MSEDGIRIGAIDVGTNSVHLIIAEVSPSGEITVLETQREQVQLGAGGLDAQMLTPAAWQRGVAALQTFKDACDSFGCVDVHAAATSAVREAKNGGDFCRDVKERTGIHVRIIPGREEARLIYLGARADLDFSRGRVLIVDLGGGSTEFILCDAESALVTQSLPLGHLRLSDTYHNVDPLGKDQISEMRVAIRKGIVPLTSRVHADDFTTMVGTSGTIRALALMATLARGDVAPEHSHGLVLQRTELQDLLKVLRKTPRDKLIELPGMDAKRINTLPAGAVLIDEVMEVFNQTSLVTSERSLRNGLLVDWVMRHRPEVTLLQTVSDPRRRAILTMMGHYQVNTDHAEHVVRSALKIFDATQPAHGLRIDDRRMLEFAALIHDCGHHISGKDHQKHGQYLVTHSRMSGFTSPEIAVLGNIVRYHRKGRPRRRHESFAALERTDQRRVRVLSAILAVADALDRSHSQVVESVDVKDTDDALIITALTSGDPGHLERWATENRVEALSELLAKPIQVEVRDPALSVD